MRKLAVDGSVAALVAVALTACSSCRDHPRHQDATHAAAPRDAAPSHALSLSDAAPDPDAGFAWYRFVAKIDDLGDVPFIVGVHHDRPEGWIVSAGERLPLVVVQRSPLVLRIPVRGVELRLAPDGAGGRLRGQWLVAYYFKRDFDIVAEPIAGPQPERLFPDGDPPTLDLAGTWRIDIKEFGVGRAIFRQDAHGIIGGTIIPPEVGDLRYLTGRVTGDRARLSAFDGIHGFFIDLIAQDGGRKLTGHWVIAGIGDFPFTATREDAPATHLSVGAHLAQGKTRIALPALDRPPYVGNPVIVDYFGSWCPVCLDLTPELVRLRREHAAAGLQVLSIALEPVGDEAETRRRLDEFRTAFGVTWPFEVRFTDDFVGAISPEILDASGFPVTIFLRRDHTVAAIHTGFVSRAAGAEHAAVVKQFDQLTADLVAPPPR